MQRQSLGSPSTKLLHHHHHLHDPNSTSSSSSPTKSISIGEIIQVEDEEEEINKKLKLKKPNTIKININTKPETYIHLIPMLTLLCFLILYLSSHNPSANDLAQFNAFNHHLHNPEEIIGEGISELMEVKKGDILTIRSLKNIKQGGGGGVNVRVTGGGLGKHRRLHRKFGIV